MFSYHGFEVIQTGRAVLAFVFFVGVLAICAIALAVVNMARLDDKLDDDDGTDAGTRTADNQPWIIAVGKDYGALEFIDENGYHKGFGSDLIDEVCREAGMECHTVVEEYNRCWESPPSGGLGLMSNWYVACMGWYTTVERMQVFGFSLPFLNPPPINFFVQKGDASFDAHDIDGKTIGFIEGWAADPNCLSRQSTIHGGSEAPTVVFASVSEAVTGLQNGEVDALFVTYTPMESYVTAGEIDVISSDAYQCIETGEAMMARKGSEFVSQFDKGLRKLRSGGRLKELCDKANADYGSRGKLYCLL